MDIAELEIEYTIWNPGSQPEKPTEIFDHINARLATLTDES